MPTTFKTQHNGEEITVELPEGALLAADANQLKKNLEITRRKLKKATEEAPSRESLLKDRDFIKEVFDHEGVPFDGEGKFKLPDNLKDAAEIEATFKSRLEIERQKWESKFLKPVQEKADQVVGDLKSARRKNLLNTLEHGARSAGVKQDKFVTMPFGERDFRPVHAAADQFRFVTEDGVNDWVLYDGEDMQYDAKGRPITAGESYWKHFHETADDTIKKEWFEDTRQKGSGFNHLGGGVRPAYMISAEEARVPAKYRAATEAARKAGRERPEIQE